MTPNGDVADILEQLCGTWEYHLQLLRRDPDYRLRFIENEAFINQYIARNADAAFRISPAVIPVVVHVVYNTPAQNISDVAIQNQIDALNRDYTKANSD